MNTQRQQHGYSLVEMMVAIVIGLFLSGAAVAILMSSKQTYTVQDDLARLQENARFALDAIASDLRMAGYVGCGNSLADTKVHINGAVAGDVFDLTNGIEGLDNATATVSRWQPSNNNTDAVAAHIGTTAGYTVAGTDAITIRRFGGLNLPITANAEKTGDIAVVQTAQLSFDKDEIAAISDCTTADVFQITNTPADAGATVFQHAASGTPGNVTADLQKRYAGPADGGSSFVSRFASFRYFIGNGENGPALFRQGYSSAGGGTATDELLEGVENMQITYGVDTNADGIPDSYVAATNATLALTSGWSDVAAVRVGLLLRTSKENPANEADASTYTLNGQALTFGGQSSPGDHRKRRMVTTTIFLRNNSW